MEELKNINQIFDNLITEYHIIDDINQSKKNTFKKGTFQYLLFDKAWIDCVQWHLEDIIRIPTIVPKEALKIKRRIDQSNQDRTECVELIDDYFFRKFQKVKVNENATINTETPAWAIDRLSILALKIYHMKAETLREFANESHKKKCNQKLDILLTQRVDLTTAIERLLEDIEQGKKYMKVYRQMKMYNDTSLNPMLYKNK